jgi:exopolyphosphatase / guanosine-5'-triphosphate,3'-diphosphate pyrophosphatase
MRQGNTPPVGVQGFELRRDTLEELIELLASKPASKRGEVSGIKLDRGDVILGGALTLAATMERGGFEAIEVAEAGLREGIFFERLLGERELFDDVRRESVENLGHRFNSEPEHAGRVADLSLEMFDGLAAAGLHELGGAERELLWAASILHDIGTAIDYEDHHRHSHYLILNAGLPGYTPRELVLVGLIARYHRRGDPDASELGDLAEPGDEQRLRLLCALIRLAEQFERSRDGAIRRVSVGTQNGTVTLAADADPERDTTVPIWAARRNADLLEQALDREVEIAP